MIKNYKKIIQVFKMILLRYDNEMRLLDREQEEQTTKGQNLSKFKLLTTAATNRNYSDDQINSR
jgi:hypothetical protein